MEGVTFLMRKILARLRLMWVEKKRMALKESRMYQSQPRRGGKGPNTSFKIIPKLWNTVGVGLTRVVTWVSMVAARPPTSRWSSLGSHEKHLQGEIRL